MENLIQYEYKTGDNLFFTSDTHFGHDKICEWCKRPWNNTEEHDAGLIANWNSVVSDNDIVFHLGDFCFGGSQKWNEVLSQLRGTKILILGNHDRKCYKASFVHQFDYVTYQMQIIVEGRSVYLNHFPFLCWAGSQRPEENRVWQLHGHLHTGPGLTSYDIERIKRAGKWSQFDVGVDNNNWTPVSWKQVCERINHQKELYA